MNIGILSDTRIASRLAIAALVLTVSVDVLESVLFGNFIVNARDSNYSDFEELQNAANVVDLVSYLAIAVSFLAAAGYINWFYRAYRNLGRLGKQLSQGPGWAIGAWFVPILTLFRPYNIFTEMVEGYSIIAKRFPDHVQQGTPSEAALKLLGGWWWGFYVGGRIFSNIANRAVAGADELPGVWVVWPNYVLVIAGVLAILVVIRLNRLEGVAYRAWSTGDYQRFVEERELAKANPQQVVAQSDKPANWYKTEAENEKSLNRNEDPFQ